MVNTEQEHINNKSLIGNVKNDRSSVRVDVMMINFEFVLRKEDIAPRTLTLKFALISIIGYKSEYLIKYIFKLVSDKKYYFWYYY